MSLDCSGEIEGVEKRLSGVDITLTNGQEQRIVIGRPPALSPHVDGLDSYNGDRRVELWDNVGFLDRVRTNAGAGSDELAGRLTDALVDDSKPIVIGV